MAVTYTLTQVGKTNKIGNRQQKFYDLTADTGTYVTGGNTFTARSNFGLSRLDKVEPCSAVTGGTAGATINWLGVIYNAASNSVTVQQYECAATGLPGLEKTSGEATVANFAVRLEVVGQ